MKLFVCSFAFSINNIEAEAQKPANSSTFYRMLSLPKNIVLVGRLLEMLFVFPPLRKTNIHFSVNNICSYFLNLTAAYEWLAQLLAQNDETKRKLFCCRFSCLLGSVSGEQKKWLRNVSFPSAGMFLSEKLS